MKLIFYGAGEFGLPTLQSLVQQHHVALVVTQPDRPAGRNQQLQPTPIAAWAFQQGLSVLKCENVNQADIVEAVGQIHAQASIVIAFGQKLSPELIAASGSLVVNLHSSLLPAYRGAAPINWAILKNEKETGVSVISLSQKMDAGLIYTQIKTPISPTETAGELHDRLAALGPRAVNDVLQQSLAGTLKGLPQDESKATKAPKLSRADAWVDFTQPASQIVARIHGLTPWPGVKVLWQQTQSARAQELILRRVQVVSSSHQSISPVLAPGTVLDDLCVLAGDQQKIQLLEVQLPGGKPMSFEAFLRGRPMHRGDQLLPFNLPHQQDGK